MDLESQVEIEVTFQQELIAAIADLSSTSVWYESPAAVAAATGLAAVIASVVTHLFNQKSESRRESSQQNLIRLEHDNRMREKMHDKQVTALIVLSSINEKLLPTVWPSPDYDSHQAYSEVIWNMRNLLQDLDKYLKNWSYALPDEVINKIRDVIYQCNVGHWGATTATSPDYEPTNQEIEAAVKIVNDLGSALSSLKDSLGLKNS